MSATRPVALITGGARRVGRAITEHLAASGFDVAVHYNNSGTEAASTVEACRRAGARAESFQRDLTRADAPAALVNDVHAAFGRLDALVNSAARMQPMALDAVTPAQWDEVFALNVRAPFFMSIAAATVLEEGGSIVNISDHLSHDSMPRLVPHAVSKSAVEAMTRHLAVQLAPRVRVNAVEPGAVLPPDDWPDHARERFLRGTPLRRVGSPQDVAGAVLYLLSAQYVTGHVLVVDGGRRVR